MFGNFHIININAVDSRNKFYSKGVVLMSVKNVEVGFN